jgi:hypothetical protein
MLGSVAGIGWSLECVENPARRRAMWTAVQINELPKQQRTLTTS